MLSAVQDSVLLCLLLSIAAIVSSTAQQPPCPLADGEHRTWMRCSKRVSMADVRSVCARNNIQWITLRFVKVQPLLDVVFTLREPGSTNCLSRLTIRHTNISQVVLDHDLPNLQRLYVEYTKLDKIPTIQQRLPELLMLSLSFNELTEVRADQNTSKSFANVPKLTTLNLRGNAIARIDPQAFANLSHLQKLDLTNNRLVTIAPGTLLGANRLQTILLHNNRITDLPAFSLGGPALTTINLTGNPIRTIAFTFTTLSKRTEISIDSHQLHCDCNLKLFIASFTHLNSNIKATCGSPGVFKGQKLNSSISNLLWSLCSPGKPNVFNSPVPYPPKITKHPSNITSKSSAVILQSCHFTTSFATQPGTVRVEWSKDGLPYPPIFPDGMTSTVPNSNSPSAAAATVRPSQVTVPDQLGTPLIGHSGSTDPTAPKLDLWYRRRREVPEVAQDVRISSTVWNVGNEFTANLLIHKAEISDSGIYVCRVQTPQGNTTSMAGEITMPAVIVQATSSLSIHEGHPAVLQCVGRGSSLLKFRWEFRSNNDEFRHLTMENIMLQAGAPEPYKPETVFNSRTRETTSSLKLPSVKGLHDGVFKCVFGSAKKSIRVTVNAKPKMFRGFNEKHLELVHQTATMQCRATGSLPLTFEWARVAGGSHRVLHAVGDELQIITNGRTSTLIIAKTKLSDLDVYECAAKNAFGRDSVRHSLFVGEQWRADEVTTDVVRTSKDYSTLGSTKGMQKERTQPSNDQSSYKIAFFVTIGLLIAFILVVLIVAIASFRPTQMLARPNTGAKK